MNIGKPKKIKIGVLVRIVLFGMLADLDNDVENGIWEQLYDQMNLAHSITEVANEDTNWNAYQSACWTAVSNLYDYLSGQDTGYNLTTLAGHVSALESATGNL